MEGIINNWETILVAIGAGIVGADTLAITVISSLGRIRDKWRSVFPKDADYDG